MKSNKLALIILFLGLIISTDIFAYRLVVSRSKLNGGNNGYSDVKRTSYDFENAQGVLIEKRVSIHCADPGSSSCPLSIAHKEPSDLDIFETVPIAIQGDLLNICYEIIEDSNASGTSGNTGVRVENYSIVCTDGSITTFTVLVTWQSLNSDNITIEFDIQELN